MFARSRCDLFCAGKFPCQLLRFVNQDRQALGTNPGLAGRKTQSDQGNNCLRSTAANTIFDIVHFTQYAQPPTEESTDYCDRQMLLEHSQICLNYSNLPSIDAKKVCQV